MPFVGKLKCNKCGDTKRDADQEGSGMSLDSPCVWIDCDGTYQDED